MAGETPAVAQKRFHDNPINVWTAGIKTPLRHYDRDARLPDPGLGDKAFGQDGWTVAFEFSNFADLANKLGKGAFSLPPFVCKNYISDCGPIEEFQVVRLAIVAHGAPGAVDVDGIFKSAADADEADKNVPPTLNPRLLNILTLKSGKYQKKIDLIRRCLHDRSKVFLMGCRIASGTEGKEFLIALSEQWPGTEVVAISTIGYQDGAKQSKTGSTGSSSYPGMRDTTYTSHKKPGFPIRDYEKLDVWNNLKKLPWVNIGPGRPTSPHVTVAFNGFIIPHKP
jgi:hypothetical protein